MLVQVMHHRHQTTYRNGRVDLKLVSPAFYSKVWQWTAHLIYQYARLYNWNHPRRAISLGSNMTYMKTQMPTTLASRKQSGPLPLPLYFIELRCLRRENKTNKTFCYTFVIRWSLIHFSQAMGAGALRLPWIKILGAGIFLLEILF